MTDEDGQLKRKHSPFHEAGHVVVGHHRGLRVMSVVAKETGTTAALTTGLTAYQIAIAYASYYPAGTAAEIEFLNESHPDFGGGDRKNLEDLRAANLEWAIEIRAAEIQVPAIVKTYRDVVSDLAEALAGGRTVSGTTLEGLLARIPVDMPPTSPPTQPQP